MERRPFLIKGGLLVDPAAGTEGVRDILLENGKVSAVARRISPGRSFDGEVFDAAGLWVLPGLVDLHVHLREPGRTEDETVLTGSEAAARGGVTTVLAMPNTKPAVDSPALVRRVLAAGRKGPVTVLTAAAVTRGQAGRALTDFEACAAAGASAFSDDGFPVTDGALMRRALEAAKRLGLPVLDHAEDLGCTGRGVLAPGAARRLGVAGIPPESEVLMAARDIALARLTGGPLHLCHVSCAGTVALLREAKRQGLRVSAEAAPHHFTLTDAQVPRGRSAADWKMKPPLRAAADRRAVRAALRDGTIDAIATDHAPHHPSKKAVGVCGAPFGIIGLETSLPLSLELWRAGLVTRRRLVELLSASGARLLGLKAKGTLRRGADADLVAVDPDLRWTPRAPYASKSRNTPFTGRALRGRAVLTVARGRPVWRLRPGPAREDRP
ncbi:MAG: dihydroorotase [Elusimicrobia bacterium]|nr:dihydroorotase [Elusimicrobiota bacterium]